MSGFAWNLLTCKCVPTDVQLVEGAEAKAYYGLTVNYKSLEALVERLLVKDTLSGKEVAETLENAGVIKFPDPYVEGFAWDPSGSLIYPGMPEEVRALSSSASQNLSLSPALYGGPA